MVFENLKLLRENMEIDGRTIEPFSFYYKKHEYCVLVKLFVKNEEIKKSKYAIVKLVFLKDDFNYNFSIEANRNGFIIENKEITEKIRRFFGIDYVPNTRTGDILNLFYNELAKYIPTKINNECTEKLKKAAVYYLNKSVLEDENKIYCYTIRRNPDNGQRSKVNSDKTRYLRPLLYNELKVILI